MGFGRVYLRDLAVENNVTSNLEKIIDLANDVLGEPHVEDWLDKTSGTLGDSPKKLSETEEGTRAVLLHLTGISRRNRFD